MTIIISPLLPYQPFGACHRSHPAGNAQIAKGERARKHSFCHWHFALRKNIGGKKEST
jgi:hypothetical protein